MAGASDAVIRGFPLRGARMLWTAGLLAAGAAGLIALLLPQWLSDPDLSHGVFAPIASVLLFNEARRHGARRFLDPGPARWLAGTTLGLGLLALLAGGLYSAALEWSHAMVGFTLTWGFALLLLATVLAGASREVRLLPCNWSALLAAGIWTLAAPVPPGTYMRLTLGLQLWVTENVLGSLQLLGIAARQHGNVIELARTSVGIEDACSGIRSLISCVFAALFFSGTLVRRPLSRFIIVALAGPIALVMNFLRSLALTLLANAGVSIEGAWHDWTGYGILAVTAALLAGLAFWLGRGERPDEALPAPVPAGSVPRWLPVGLGLGAAATAFFVFHAPFVPASPRPAPDLEALLPTSADGWRVTTAADLNRFKDTLQTDRFVQRTYSRVDAQGPLQFTVYIAYWAPGQASASLVATHTPDACWPGGGWEALPIADTQAALDINGSRTALAEQRLFENQGYPQHVWFWHLYDRAPIPFINPLSPRNLIEIAARYGFRRAGDQMFIRVSSNRTWNAIADERLVAEVFSGLQGLGL